MDVIIVCHTEFGFVNDKRLIYDKNSKNGVVKGVINLIKIAGKYDAKVTFAVCPEVVDFFPKNINHEIGLHIHPGWEEYSYKNFKWIVGDEYLKKNCKQSLSSTALRDYSYKEQLELIKTGRDYIKEKLNVTPKVFVAGRWSLNNTTVKALIENGFTHDCSALAHFVSNHYDWSNLPRICIPYHPDKDDYQNRGNLPILITPVSRCFAVGSVNPEIIPITGLSWLKAAFLEHYKQNVPLFHIYLHSPSMTDNYFISATDTLLSFISKYKNINFKFVSEIGEYPFTKIRENIFPYLFAINYNFLKGVLRKFLKIKNEEYIKQNNI